jgi:hypothetical protein
MVNKHEVDIPIHAMCMVWYHICSLWIS